METSAERLREIDRVFAEALDVAPGERMAFLARMRGNDPELAGEVSDLLRLAEQPDSRLVPERVLGGPFWADWIDGEAVAAGERIGAWRVLRELGRGGMATVFLAERADAAFRHRVALKLLRSVGGSADAERFLREVLAIRRRHLGEDNLVICESLTDLGSLLQSKGAAPAVPRHQDPALPPGRSEPRHPDAHPRAGARRPGGHAAAEQLYRRSVAVLRQGLGPEDPVVAMSQDSLGRLLATRGNFAEDDELLTATLALRRRLYGATHPTISVSLLNLGNLRQRQGRHGEARELFDQAFAMSRDLLGADHPLTHMVDARRRALDP